MLRKKADTQLSTLIRKSTSTPRRGKIKKAATPARVDK